MAESKMKKLMNTLPQVGEVVWIGVRPERRAPLTQVEQVEATPGEGLEGDRFTGEIKSKRQVTLIQKEHIDAVSSVLGHEAIDPGLLRRNIVVKGINLLALKGKQFQIGSATLEGTGPCAPCSRMEENLGAGGYNAMRGHGGLTARVITPGIIKIGDNVSFKEIIPLRIS